MQDNEFQTLDVDYLQLACPTTQKDMATNVFETQAEIYSVEETIDCFETLVAVAMEQSTFSAIDVCEIHVTMKKIEETMPASY